MKFSHPSIFYKSLFGSLTIISFGIFFWFRGIKDKTEFSMLKGRITYLNKTFNELPFRHPGKFWYLKIENYQRVFEIFVGKDWGDFKPKFECIDQLNLGDSIDVYFEEDVKEEDIRINRLAQYIDRNGKAIFIRGEKDKYGGIFLAGCGFVLLIFLFYLKSEGRIS